MFERMRAAWLVERVNRNKKAAVRLTEEGHPGAAADLNARAIVDVHTLKRLEPNDPMHDGMLGNLHYNGANIYEELGRLGQAVASARASLGAYESLPGRVDAVAHVADAKARLAQLLALHVGAAAADEVHLLGRAAVAAYDELVATQPEHADGLARVRSRYEEARQALGG